MRPIGEIMTHGNTSWHELGQTYVDQSKDLNQSVTDNLLERTERQLMDAKAHIHDLEEIKNALEQRIQLLESQALTREKQLSEWILHEKAFRETALTFGYALGKNNDEIKHIVQHNINAVLTNTTLHHNNASSSPVLHKHASDLLKNKGLN